MRLVVQAELAEIRRLARGLPYTAVAVALEERFPLLSLEVAVVEAQAGRERLAQPLEGWEGRHMSIT